METAFSDVLAANREYSTSFQLGELSGSARRGLAIVTCIDSRIDPLAMLGLVPGDAKIIRNAGARVTDDVIRSLVLATNLLSAERVMVIGHTRCAMADTTDDIIRRAVAERIGEDRAHDLRFLSVENQLETLASDVEVLRRCPLLAPGTIVEGFIYDVDSGVVRALADVH